MRVLVTGGAGYIGSHACKALSAAGHTPIALDNLVHGHRWAVRWGPFEQVDLFDRSEIDRVLREHHIDAVIHFAAYAYVGESMTAPGKYFRNNVVNTINLLDAVVSAGIKWFVFSSSCATYGIPDVIPIDESSPQKPINPYGETKLISERALHWYGLAHPLRSVALRYFNAAGADPECEIGEDHDPEPHLIPLVIETALGRRPELLIMGTDYPTPDGTAIRDYIHVTDLADAHVQALHYLENGGASQALNLGTGKGHSVLDVVKTVESVTRQKVKTRNAPRRPGDPPSLVAEAGRAQALLGWSPQLSGLDTIVSTAHNWHRSHFAPRSA